MAEDLHKDLIAYIKKISKFKGKPALKLKTNAAETAMLDKLHDNCEELLDGTGTYVPELQLQSIVREIMSLSLAVLNDAQLAAQLNPAAPPPESHDAMFHRLYPHVEVLDKLEVVRWISEEQFSGQGDCWLLQCKSEDGRTVFVKLVKNFAAMPASRKLHEKRRMTRETCALYTLRQNNVAGVLRLDPIFYSGWTPDSPVFETTNGVPFLITNALEHGCLLQLEIKQNAHLQHADRIQLVAVFFDAFLNILSACHRLGIVHRDIKADNIYLLGGNLTEPVLLDFGQVFMPNDETLTLTKETVGNMGLILPEVMELQQTDADELEDLNEEQRIKLQKRGMCIDTAQAAAVFVRLLFGAHQQPVVSQDESFMTTLKHPVFASHYQLYACLFRALQYHPKDRYQHAGAMQAEFAAVWLPPRPGLDFDVDFKKLAVSAEKQVAAAPRNDRDHFNKHLQGLVMTVLISLSLQPQWKLWKTSKTGSNSGFLMDVQSSAAKHDVKLGVRVRMTFEEDKLYSFCIDVATVSSEKITDKFQTVGPSLVAFLSRNDRISVLQKDMEKCIAGLQ